MGLFSNLGSAIGNKMSEMKAESDEAYMEGIERDGYWICSRIKSVSSLSKKNGYMRALKEKIRDMSDYELKNLFDRSYRDRNGQACNILICELEERGYMEKVDGRWKKQNW